MKKVLLVLLLLHCSLFCVGAHVKNMNYNNKNEYG